MRGRNWSQAQRVAFLSFVALSARSVRRVSTPCLLLGGVPELRWQHGGPTGQTAGAIGAVPGQHRVAYANRLTSCKHRERVARRQA